MKNLLLLMVSVCLLCFDVQGAASLLSVTNTGGGVSLINSSNAPVPIFRSLTNVDGSVTIVNNGSNIVISSTASGGGGTVGTVINTTTGAAGYALTMVGTNPTNTVPLAFTGTGLDVRQTGPSFDGLLINIGDADQITSAIRLRGSVLVGSSSSITYSPGTANSLIGLNGSKIITSQLLSGLNLTSGVLAINDGVTITNASLVGSGLNTNTILSIDSSGKIQSTTVNVGGTVTGVLPVANGGTASATATTNAVFAAPDGGSTPATPSFRQLTTNDIPAINLGRDAQVRGGVIGKLPAGNISDTAVTPGSYTLTSLTVDQQGRITSASSGASSSGFPLTANANLAGWGMTNGSRYVAVVTNLALTTVTNAAIDASTASAFRVLLTQPNVFFPAPSNGQVEQAITVYTRQDSTGYRTCTFATNWIFGTDITGITLSTNKMDIFKAIMVDPTNNVWAVTAFVRGYAQ